MASRLFLGAALCGSVLAMSPVAQAQSSGTQNYFTPPKLLKTAATTLPVPAPGTVVVQVLVKSDGSFIVQKVIRSTNHADDAAALDVAKHSTYAPAKRGKAAVVAFYDFTLKLNPGAASQSNAAAPTGLAAYEAELHAGNYSGAQTGLKAYVAQHPDDVKAQTDLGVADTYLDDYEGATAAFDKVGTIGDAYKSVAAKAYAEYAAAEMKNKENDKALAAAKRAAEIAPGFFTLNTLGYMEFTAGDYPTSIADLEKARALGQSTNAKAHDRVQVDDNLLSAYLAAGRPDDAKPVAAEIAQLDPSDTSAQNIMAASIVKAAQAAQDAGKPADAGALFEQAASAAPSQAATLYGNAALAYLAVKPNPANDKAKAAADKALAVNPGDAGANYAEGIVLANTGKSQDAVGFLNKADAAAKQANNASLSAAVERALKQISDTK
jgi:lipopolysaccharide biosynthesis regulator YciM